MSFGCPIELAHLGCREMAHAPEEMNFSSCFLASLAFRHADFSASQRSSGLHLEWGLTAISDDLEAPSSGPHSQSDQVPDTQCRMSSSWDAIDQYRR